MSEESQMSQEQMARRWRVRRRFAIIAFAEIVSAPLWMWWLMKRTNEGFATGIFGTLMFVLVTIVLAYIGGTLADDNLNKWKGK